MTREQEILARAMNRVDDELIAAAWGPRKKLRHYIPALAAACLCLVIVVSFPYLRAMINLGGDKSADALPPPSDAGNQNNVWFDMGALLAGKKPEFSPPTQGDTVEIGRSTVTMTALTEHTATLHMVKQDAMPLYIAFHQAYAGFIASTQPNFRDGDTILRPNQIKIYINGATEPTDMLPTEVGEYTVIVDFTSLRNGTYRMEDTMTLYTFDGHADSIIRKDFVIDLAYTEAHGRPLPTPETDTEAHMEA